MKFGKYEIIKEIGKGAMGVVYLAFDPIIERQVAIKTMNPQLFQDKEQRERFFREAKSAGILQHPNIVTIYDMGIEGDTPYIVMEFVEGEDLDSLIKQKKLDVESSIKIMIQLCDALSYAHSKGIIHRDIKPSNIRVLPDNTIKIMDFGIAKKSGSDLTQTGVLLGTVSYMAPEQLKEGKVSPQSDQFSAGIVFYEMLSGDKCFQGDTITSVMYKIVSFNEHQINLESVPQTIVSILKKMVSHQSGNRFRLCSEVSDTLKGILGDPTVKIGEGTKTMMAPPPVPQYPTSPRTRVKINRKDSVKNKKPVGLIVFFIVIIFLLSAVSFTVYKKRHKKIAKLNKNNATQVDKAVDSRNGGSGGETEVSTDSKELQPSDNTGVKSNNSAEEVEKKPEEMTQQREEGNIEQKPKEEGTIQQSGEKPLNAKTVQNVTRQTRQEQTERQPVKRNRSVPDTQKEKEVFSYSKSVKKKEGHLNFSEAQKETLKSFKKKAETMPYPIKIARANLLFNTGMRALGNGANRFAATSFYKSIILNPKRKEAYSFLCVALARMKAYTDVKKVIKMANKNGITLYDLRQNKMFDTMYNKLQQSGKIE